MRDGVVETASSDFVFADGLNEARLEGAMDMVGLEVDATFALYPSDRQKPVLWQITGNLDKPDIKADASAFNLTAAAPSATPPRAGRGQAGSRVGIKLANKVGPVAFRRHFFQCIQK